MVLFPVTGARCVPRDLGCFRPQIGGHFSGFTRPLVLPFAPYTTKRGKAWTRLSVATRTLVASSAILLGGGKSDAQVPRESGPGPIPPDSPLPF